ncbi:MAG: hypothetical protein DLM61_03620 [Pseudonocardiales bacterium]|nr:MAG: hypothetical protein DLM61_03620 [Pseudonocardiales bacterium]
MRVSFETVNGVHTRILAAGDGPDSLIAIHGGGLTADVYVRNLDALGRDRLVLAPDLPNSGFSGELPGAGPFLPRLRDFLLEFADRFASGRCALLGNSLGAQMAVLLHLADPVRFGELVLTPSATAFHEGKQLQTALQDTLSRSMPATGSAIDMRREFEGLRYLCPSLTDASDILTSLATAHALPHYGPRLRSMLLDLTDLSRNGEYYVADRLAEITARVLIVWGRRDPRTVYSDIQSRVAHLQNTAMVTFDDAGHMPFLEDPDRFNRTVAAFLVSVGGTAPTI